MRNLILDMYANGRGVIQSDTLAFKYYQLSAIQGYASAQSNVGFLCKW